MALIHEKLYRSENLAEINFGGYIKSLIETLIDSFGTHVGPVDIEVTDHGVSLEIDTAIPCALMVNELVTNALKYAFRHNIPGVDRPPQIRAEIARDSKNGLTLTVSDNGCGFPEHLDFRDTESLGLQIVNTLTHQLDGTIELDNEEGTTFTFRCTEINSQSRSENHGYRKSLSR